MNVVAINDGEFQIAIKWCGFLTDRRKCQSLITRTTRHRPG
jgi:hypothetical protein